MTRITTTDSACGFGRLFSSQNAPITAPTLSIGPYRPEHEDDLFAAYSEAIEEGGSFPGEPPADREHMRAVWLTGNAATVSATLGGAFAGFYYLRPNFSGRASDIANAGYLVASGMRGRGIGRALLEHSLAEARQLGFRAMIFNLVFEHNPARRLWEAAGFEVIGRIPGAIGGAQDALIYWREL
jgi:GNAT superfamily N-acetyltransferase